MKRAEQAAAIAARLHHALHLAEAGQDQSINRLGKLAQALTRSRKEAGLSATVGQPAFNALARAMAAQIESIPTLMAFRDGVAVFRHSGSLPQSALDDLIGQIGALDMDDVRWQIAESPTAA